MIGSLTARQVAILTVTGLVLYAAWTVTRTVIPLLVFLIPAIPLAASAAILALGQRDGITLDRLALAAIRQRLAPRHRVAGPEGARPAPDWLTTHATGDALPGTRGARPAALHLPATGVHTTTATGGGVGVGVGGTTHRDAPVNAEPQTESVHGTAEPQLRDGVPGPPTAQVLPFSGRCPSRCHATN